MKLRVPPLRAILLAGVLLALNPPAVRAQQKVDFNRDIRPILSDSCFACHGPDDANRMAGLRLDTKEGAFAETNGGAAVHPGDSAASKLYQRVSTDKKGLRMPPVSSGRTLSGKQIELIRQWIDEGASWETHWAYTTPKRAEPPPVQDAGWSKNPIDAFILDRLKKEGLKPAGRADAVTLLRRVTLDLTGLPPAPAEIDSFLADKSPNAYEKRVEQLLASPRYGERMAMQWLDLARYADTHGYHIDSHRDMWPWRDWLIQAFNKNMPFDRFTIEQLAGDLLPGAGRDALIASGFNRNHMINYEGGAIPEEYLVEYVVDRVETTSTVWMGMTTGCARCHDHKYDPIQQKDFYRFFAFFNNVKEKGLDGREGNADPVLQLPTMDQETRQKQLQEALETLTKALPEDAIEPLQKAWEKEGLTALPEPPRDGLLAHYELDGNFADSSGRYLYGRALRGEVGYPAGPLGKSAEFGGETHVSLGQVGQFDKGDPFSLAFWFRFSGAQATTLIQQVEDSESRRGYELALDDPIAIGDLKRGAHLHIHLTGNWPEDGVRVKTKRRLVQRDWYHLVLNYSGSGRADGLELFLDGKPEPLEILHNRLTGSIRTEGPLEIGNPDKGKAYKGQLDDLRVYSRTLHGAEIETLAIHHPVRYALLGTSGKRSKEETERLRDYFLSYGAPEPYRSTYHEWKALTKESKSLEKTIQTTMVMAELTDKPRETFILGRGDYRNKTEKVEPGVPSFLPPLPANAPANRLGLAQWLVDPGHPLTARVAVNRFWQMYFGQGLVKTAEDFGSQGEMPSHPELLDWLATEFIRTGWDMKAMQRLIVTSAAYQQDSRATKDLVERDPENRLLARGPRFRMPAEMVRDNALAASGLLVEKLGGPSVYPYQPEGVWEDVAYGDVFSAQSYTPDKGEKLYRRSMYTFWKRTAPPPSLATFDAPDREKCLARRPLTNTPLQALVLLNDPTYVEAARALAERALREAGKDTGKRIDHIFRLATARRPAPAERQVLRDAAERHTAAFRRDQQAALDLASVGDSKPDPKFDPSELAAWTTVASMILNLDETITKE